MEQPPLPRVTIQFCTQCKWMLRAAYVSPLLFVYRLLASSVLSSSILPRIVPLGARQAPARAFFIVFFPRSFAQELLSTFSTSLGEVALQPSTGGTFVVHLYHANPTSIEDEPVTMQKHLLWDRKAEGGFPETKELKRRVRDIIDPSRNLGHVDGHKKPETSPESKPSVPTQTSALPTRAPIPAAINRLQAEGTGERKFTPMDVDVDVSAQRDPEGEDASGNGKIRIGGDEGEGEGFCRPGDEDCG
ncbi:hypothetical protein LARI1_G000361 [Lachnellula arida]|uniref:Selenoprotein W-like protein n=1 Tax=Lachnellula arida TaxID=1316785 RepID=A0A8T9BP92_9HELO|nr:hypothetical protein LARI1_G000361 [Lachnellula arida]